MASSTTDSGTETLFSDDSIRESSCELISPTSVYSGEDTLCQNDNSDRLSVNSRLAPPNIQPYSGVLEKGKVVIKPIAFKPSNSHNNMSPSSRFSDRYGSTPILTRPGSRLTLYGSTTDLSSTSRPPLTNQIQNYSLDRKLRATNHNHYHHHSASVSSPPLAMSSLPSLPNSHKLVNYDSLESVRKSPAGHRDNNMEYYLKNQNYSLSSSNMGSLADLTPSPSDSGVSELEAALRDRDSELAYLRQTMEHNEHVIFRVYKEKEKVWEREIHRLKTVHESRLKASAQKALKLEHMLMMQSYQHNQDKKRLIAELQRANCQNDKFKSEVTALRTRLEETEWSLCQKTGEISLMKTQLKDFQNDQATKCQELLQLRSDLRDLQHQLQNYENLIKNEKSQNFEKDNQILALKSEIDYLRNQIDIYKDQNFEANQKDKEISSLRNEITEYNRKYQSDESLIKKIDDVTENERLRTEIKELREELSDISLNDYSNTTPGRILRAKKIVIDNSTEDLTSEDLEIQKLNGEYIEDNHIYGDITNIELQKLKKELDLKSQQFEQEKLNWSQEKEKVLRYQRQLQMNYMQIFRKCKVLETEVQNLSIQLAIDQGKNQEKP